MAPIYLDYNATTPIDPEVIDYMKPYLTDHFGNPSSSHSYGIRTRQAIEKARKQVAKLINCQSSEIVFTSGGTESNNYAIKGAVMANRHKGNHIITSAIEHPAVLQVCKYLEANGFEVSYIPVNKRCRVEPGMIESAITPRTILVSIMHANNEVGTIQPIKEIAEITKEKNIIFHTDAAQSAGKIQIDVQDLGVDLLSLAGHKFYGPKGIGGLYIRPGITLEKLIHGADHESDRRAGTENVLEIAGLGKACEIALRDLEKNARLMQESRDRFYKKIKRALPFVIRNGDPDNSLPNTLSLSFPNIEASLLLASMEQIAASAGAACHSDQSYTSHVLEAMNIPTEHATGTIRFSTGKYTTDEEIDQSTDIIIKNVRELINTDMDSSPQHLSEKTIKLTHFTHGLGCACKIQPQLLKNILSGISIQNDARILIDSRDADDAAVFKIDDETALIQTVDFFTPVVDDPFDFGAIAAANALSDIYAMGGDALFALNIVGFPVRRIPVSILDQILEGAQTITDEAGISVLGGHTIEDTEPKYGMVVTGICHPNEIITNNNAQPDDVLILTKPLGTGIISTALKKGLAIEQTLQNATNIMKQLNKKAAEVMRKYPIHACTDITGFGLLGHLLEMLSASGASAEIYAEKVPAIENAFDLIAADMIPGGTKNNLKYVNPNTKWQSHITEPVKILLCDAQTSGGLLIALPEVSSSNLLEELQPYYPDVTLIGQILEYDENYIYVL